MTRVQRTSWLHLLNAQRATLRFVLRVLALAPRPKALTCLTLRPSLLLGQTGLLRPNGFWRRPRFAFAALFMGFALGLCRRTVVGRRNRTVGDRYDVGR